MTHSLKPTSGSIRQRPPNPMGFGHVTVHTQKIQDNIASIQQSHPHSRVLLIAKADAYGLGAVPICQSVQDMIHMIGVATVSEAITLRDHGIRTPILLLSEPDRTDFPALHHHDIAATVYHTDTIDQLDHYTRRTNQSIATHIKIDTGMTRLGVHWDTASALIHHWQATNTRVLKTGIYSHFANAHCMDHPLNATQYHRFMAHHHLFSNKLIHFSNSDALKTTPQHAFNMIRVGYGAYKDAITLTAPVRQIQSVSAGVGVGYGSTYIATKPTRVGVIGMGYADGLSTLLSNNGSVIVDQQSCPIIGQVCMDMMMIQLPDGVTVNRHDPAIILSPSNAPGMSIETMASLTNQNCREILTRLSANRLTFRYE